LRRSRYFYSCTGGLDLDINSLLVWLYFNLLQEGTATVYLAL
jgi:hypothetical protein